MPRLVLFDIDGTLLDCGSQIRPLFAGALLEVYGTAGDLDSYDFSGKTDTGIVLDLMTGAGVPRSRVEAGLEAARLAYVARLRVGLRPEQVRVLDGVTGLLDRLRSDPEVTLGLLTGNWEQGAELKLAARGLGGYFTFGAFGDGEPDRCNLPPVALERARLQTGRRFRPEEVLIVGDSPLDVACARAHGIASLAVASGRTPAERLTASGASWVLADLEGAVPDHPAFAA